MKRHCCVLASVLLLVNIVCFQATGFAKSSMPVLEPMDKEMSTLELKQEPYSGGRTGEEPEMETIQAPYIMVSGQMGTSVPAENGNQLVLDGKTASAQAVDPYSAYFGQVMKAVRKHWYLVKSDWNPPTPITQPIKIGLAFKVQRNGSITDIRVRTSSDNLDFDIIAVQSLKDTPSVPPIPTAISEDTIDCFYTIHYDDAPHSRGH